MAADYPYAKVKDGTRIEFDSLLSPNYEYDMDHLNLVGATIFAKWMEERGLFRSR